ncbi:MAG: GtrA family protein [Acutalibacteraceae bacterium]|nr:GtrA family protein [Acutalibacteraceae bacterium]
MGNFIKQFFDVKFWKFILVGVLNTIVGTGLQFVLYNCTPLNQMATTGTWIASSVSYCLASIMSYFLNKYFTFKNNEKGWKPVVRFAVNIAVCYGIAYGLAIPLTSYICTQNNISMFGWTVEAFASNASMIIGSCLFVGLNYIGQRFFAFKEAK